MSNSPIINGGEYQPWISMLRIMATVHVVWLHTCSTLAQNTEVFEMSDAQLTFFNAGYQMMHWTVPVFFMLTGALLLNPEKKMSAIDCLIKYSFRIILAIFIFGAPFAVMKNVMETGHISVSVIPLSIKAVLENDSLSHLWYLYTLLGLYLVLPLLRLFVQYASDDEVRLVLITLFIVDFVIPLFNGLTGWKIAFELSLKYPVLYCLVGWHLKKKTDEKKAKISNRLCVVIVLMIIAFIWGVNCFDSNARVWTSYNSPVIAILSITIFMFFIGIVQVREESKKKRLWKIDRLCFGVYLIHPVFIQFVYRFLKITPMKTDNCILAVFLFSMVFTISAFAASWILSMIKPLKKYVL